MAEGKAVGDRRETLKERERQRDLDHGRKGAREWTVPNRP